ncbi:VOC family protein [Paenisporosarcina antarctica]|uniref:VOC family protein n=1 Tax=Paenisporosarcina antarctica TaxID=417367 RepID=A0A4V1ANH4_9BACL|nr:VOC family protein [Paenisporosarcina antarctica]QBP42785.1 VOC family protein [Paenisporosarcina antarctica]
MKYRMSKNIGFQVKDVEKAKHFYESILGVKETTQSDADEVEFRTNSNSIFLIPGNENLGPVMEVVVSNLDLAKKHLVENGCEIVRWEGKGRDCYVRDPFGIVFNVWEDK